MIYTDSEFLNSIALFFYDFLYARDIRFQILLRREASDQALVCKDSFRDCVCPNREVVRRFFHDIDVIYAGFPLFRPADVFVVAHLVFLAVHVVRLVTVLG